MIPHQTSNTMGARLVAEKGSRLADVIKSMIYALPKSCIRAICYEAYNFAQCHLELYSNSGDRKVICRRDHEEEVFVLDQTARRDLGHLTCRTTSNSDTPARRNAGIYER